MNDAILKVGCKIKVFYPLFRYLKRLFRNVRDFTIYIIRWGKGSCQVLTRFRLASMRRNIKRRKVNPQRLEPP